MSDSTPGDVALPALRGTSHSASSAAQAPTGFSQAVNLARVLQSKVQARLWGRKLWSGALGGQAASPSGLATHSSARTP